MIHRFAVSNYHSIREEAVLDLRVPGTAPDLPRFRPSRARRDVRLPTVAVLMGPNGSGKTTLLRALTTMARVAGMPFSSEEGSVPVKAVMPFASEPTLHEPTRFRLDVEADWLAPGEDPQLFRYELAVGRDRSDPGRPFFRYESLSHYPRGRARRIVEREDAGAPARISEEIVSALRLGAKGGRLQAIRDDTSVIGALALLNVPVAARANEWLQGVVAATNLLFAQTWTWPTQNVVRALGKNPALLSWARKHLATSDLGVRDVAVSEADAGESDWRSVLFEHHGPVGPLPLLMQSGGTRRLFHLLPQLFIALEKGVPAILDEVDADLHVDIVADLLDWFRSRETNPRAAQLLVTSHNVGLLDDLEKEELFITEKSRDGATAVHGAQDVRGLRREARLYSKYRAGVLGGVPKLG